MADDMRHQEALHYKDKRQDFGGARETDTIKVRPSNGNRYTPYNKSNSTARLHKFTEFTKTPDLNKQENVSASLTPKKTEGKKKLTVAAAFNCSDSEEEEEMPLHAKMKMRNKGKDTPTSSGPNSFGKTKRGFTDTVKMWEKDPVKVAQKIAGQAVVETGDKK